MSEKYSLTEEHRAQLKPWADKWIAIAMSTAHTDEAERKIAADAVRGLYVSASLATPRVVFVSSPLVGAFAAGFASAIWYARSKGWDLEPGAKTLQGAAGAEVRAAVAAATCVDVVDASVMGLPSETGKPLDLSRWVVLPADMPALAEEIGIGDFGLACARQHGGLHQGGNQWAGWTAFLSFFRHVVKLPIDYSKFQYWETAGHYGPRWTHRDFCIVSDRPSILKVDDQHRPHCGEGPFCEWRDGAQLFAWHGTYVPADWILNKDKLDPKVALTHENIEQRRAAAEIVGWEKVLAHCEAKVVNKSSDPEIGTLLEVNLPDAPGSKFLQVKCGTGRNFVLPVPAEMKTAKQANAWTYNLDEKELKLEART